MMSIHMERPDGRRSWLTNYLLPGVLVAAAFLWLLAEPNLPAIRRRIGGMRRKVQAFARSCWENVRGQAERAARQGVNAGQQAGGKRPQELIQSLTHPGERLRVQQQP